MPETQPAPHGVHHTARPTWKLKETVEFYRDVLGLPVVHAISAVGWGPEAHPDFIHIFFDSGRGSLIAFFYYIGTDPLEEPVAKDSWLYRSVHTAWRMESREELMALMRALEGRGQEVKHVRHEVIESIYVTDPNGYMVEFTWQMRDMSTNDALDATLTLEAAMALEAERGARLADIESVWRRKGELLAKRLKAA